VTHEATFLAPSRIEEALRMLADGPAEVLAGGTDLWPKWSAGPKPDRVLSLHRLEQHLRRIEWEGDLLRLGALTTHTDLVASEAVRAACPAVAQAAATIGAIQIQNQGTVGGNVAHGSPAADLPPPLAAAEATVELASAEGIRRVPLDRFFTGYRQLDRRPEELLIALLVPALPAAAREHFRKVGTRRAQAISKVSGACRIQMTPDGSIARAGIAFGSVAPTVVRLREVETWLVGRRPDVKTAEGAERLARDGVRPIDDLRSSADYRRHVVGRLVYNWVLGR
jgi:CO/xanthine dehydrogenase FAD-binding subunit